MTEKPEKFYIYSRNCPRRVLASSRNFKYFIQNGLSEVNNPKDADLIVIHSCGAFNLTEEFSLETIKKVLDVKSNSAEVIVTGCLPKINRSALTPYKGILIIPTEKLSMLDSIIDARFPYESIPTPSSVYNINYLYHGSLWKRIKRHLGFNRKLLTVLRDRIIQKLATKTDFPFLDQDTYKIEIVKGCAGNCTYCAIKLANQGLKSLQEDDVIKNVQFGLKKEFRKFILTGTDIGSYGIDVGTNFPNLLKKILAIEGKYVVTLNDMNPRWLVKYCEELSSILKENSEKVSKIILPVQSASNRILGLMNRQYTIDEVNKCIRDLHEKIPSIDLETHIIVGFPGESEEDFSKSLEFVKDSIFSKVWVYQYNDRPGTVASKLVPKISDKVIKEREKRLSQVANIR